MGEGHKAQGGNITDRYPLGEVSRAIGFVSERSTAHLDVHHNAHRVLSDGAGPQFEHARVQSRRADNAHSEPCFLPHFTHNGVQRVFAVVNTTAGQ